MAVYIGYYCSPSRFGRMSRMTADSHDELSEMAYAIGVPQWGITAEGTQQECLWILPAARERAIQNGATVINKE